jgi:hypothetical protein
MNEDDNKRYWITAEDLDANLRKMYNEGFQMGCQNTLVMMIIICGVIMIFTIGMVME